MKTIKVTLEQGKAFTIDDGRHRVVTDQPRAEGGEDMGPSPLELFVASIVACVGVFAQKYLDRHHLAYDGLEIEGAYSMKPAPNRVGEVRVTVRGPKGLSDEARDAVVAFAKKCTVHNSVFQPPTIDISVEGGHDE